MVAIANELRAKHGASYIVEQLYDQAVKNGKMQLSKASEQPVK